MGGILDLYADSDEAAAAPAPSGGGILESYGEELDRQANLQKVRKEAFDRNQSGVSRELEAGWEQTKGAVARTVGETTGWEAAKDYADERSAESEGLSANSGFTQSWDDVDGVGSGAGYAAKQVLNMAPGVAAMAIPGYGAAALTGRAAIGLGTAAASNLAQQTGGNLDAQIEEGGEVDLFSAYAAGVAQTGLDLATGVGGRVLSGLRKPATKVAEDVVRGGIVGFGRRAIKTAAEEGITEGAQQVLEEGARSRVTPADQEFDMNAALKRVKESAIAGALAGGAVGGVLPEGNRRRNDNAPKPSSDPEVAGSDLQTPSESDPVGGPPLLTGPAETPRLEDQRNWKREVETAEPITTPVRPSIKPQQDVLDLFTGATPETLRPASESDVVRTVRGDLPMDKNVRTITSELLTALNGGKSRGKIPVVGVAQRAAFAYDTLDRIADKLAADPKIDEIQQENYLRALARAAEVVQAYELNLEQLGVPREQPVESGIDPTAERVSAQDAGFVAPTPGQVQASQIAQGVVAAQTNQQQIQNMQAQQLAEQQRAEDLGMVEKAIPEAERLAKEQAAAQEDQAAQALADQSAQFEPALRRELVDSIIKGSKPSTQPLQQFMAGLKKINPEAQPTPDELRQLATYASLSNPEKIVAAAKQKPEPTLVKKAPQNDALLEPISVPAKTNKRQLRAQQARAEATALVPENEQPPEIKSMLKALEDAATSIDATFKSLLGSRATEGVQPSLFPSEDPRVNPAQPKGFQQYVANKIAAQDAKFEKQLAELQAAVAKITPEPAVAPEPKQEALLDAKGKPTKAAERLTKDQVAERVTTMEKEIPNDGVGAAKKLAVVPEIKSLIETAPPQAVVDLMSAISRPDTTLQDAVQLTQIVKDRYAPKPEPASRKTSEPTPEAAPQEDSESAVLDEENPGVNERDIPSFRHNPEDGYAVPHNARDMLPIVGRIIQGWRNPPRIVVFDRRNPRNEDERRAVRIYDEGAYYGMYLPLTETVYIPAGGLPMTMALLRGTIFHEALGHYGLDQQFGAQRLPIMLDIAADRADIKRAAQPYYMGMYNSALSIGMKPAAADRYARAAGVEEVLVSKWNNGELTLTADLWGRMRDMVTKFARSMGMPARRYTNGEIIHMMHSARNAVIDSDPTQTRRSLEVAGVISPKLKIPREDIIGLRRTEAATPRLSLDTASKLETYLLDRGAPAYMVRKATNIRDAAMNGRLGAMLGQTLIDYSKKLNIKNYTRLAEIQQEARKLINERNTKIDQLMVAALRLDPTASVIATGRTPRQDALKSYMRAATYNGTWGYQPTWFKQPVTVTPEAKRIADAYRAKDPGGFAVADRLMQYAYEDREAFQKAVRDYINGEADADLTEAGLTPSEIKEIEDRKSRQLKLFDKTVPKFDGPYFPLGRFGNYAAVAKSAAYLKLEQEAETSPKARTELMEMRADPKHYAVLFRDTLGEATELQRSLSAQPEFRGGKVDASVRTETFAQMGESPLVQMQKLKAMMKDALADEKFGRETSRQIDSMLKDMYVRTLADNSARKYDRKRENVAGADENMLRAFSEKMRADANALGHISTYNQEVAVTKSMFDEINGNRDEQYENRKRFLAEVLKRRGATQAVYDSPWAGIQDKMMAVSSLYHLATSPRYYIMNALQPAMFTAPLLSARHGLTESWGALNDVYSTLRPQMMKASFWKGEIDFSKMSLKPDQIAFLKAAQAAGKLDFGAQLDAGFWQGDSGRLSRAMTEANHIFRTTSSQVEFINRTAAGLAAYELAKKNPRAGLTPTQYGLDIIEQTQFNYSTDAQPRFFNMAPRIMTQFRKYQVGQLALQGRLIGDAWRAARGKGLSSAEFKEAGAALGYMYGQLGVVAGALGLPGAQLVGWIGSALFGDDDEPVDGERWMRQLFGEGMGKYALRGVPTMAGLEMDGVGLGKLLNPLPFFDYGTLDTREGIRDFMFQAGLGAFGGMLDRAVTKGVPALTSGDVQGAADAFLPSGFRNALRGFMLAQEGLTKTNGDMLLKPEEINLVESILQGIGFVPSDVKDRQKKYYEKVAFEEYYRERATELKRGWVAAAKDNDSLALRELEADWRKVQAAKVRLGLKPTPVSELYRSVREQARRQKKIDDMPVGFR